MKKYKKVRRKLYKKKIKSLKKKAKGINRSKNRNRYKIWRYKVFKRDDWTCKRCGAKKPLNAHHIKPWALFFAERYHVNNGITLCEPCHKWVHEPGRKSEYLDLGNYNETT